MHGCFTYENTAASVICKRPTQEQAILNFSLGGGVGLQAPLLLKHCWQLKSAGEKDSFSFEGINIGKYPVLYWKAPQTEHSDFLLDYKKRMIWRDGSASKGTHCPSKVLKFSSQHLCHVPWLTTFSKSSSRESHASGVLHRYLYFHVYSWCRHRYLHIDKSLEAEGMTMGREHVGNTGAVGGRKQKWIWL